jgi:hypothetical protein
VFAEAVEVETVGVGVERREVGPGVEQSIFDECGKGDEHRFAGERRAGGVGRVAGADRAGGKHLPERAPGSREEVDELAGLAADPSGAGKGGRVEEDSG